MINKFQRKKLKRGRHQKMIINNNSRKMKIKKNKMKM